MASRDRLTIAKLSGAAQRHAREQGSIAAAVDDLRNRSQGRADLLAEAAGTMAGAWSARLDAEHGATPLAAGLLILAGADLDALPHWHAVGRQRAQQPAHRAP